MDTTLCPECGALAEVLWRAVLESTDGPVEHAKISCADRHWFLLPVSRLERPTSPAPERRRDADAGREARRRPVSGRLRP